MPTTTDRLGEYTALCLLCATLLPIRFDTHVMMGLAGGKANQPAAGLALAEEMLQVLNSKQMHCMLYQ